MKDKFKIGDVIVLEFDKTTKTYNLKSNPKSQWNTMYSSVRK